MRKMENQSFWYYLSTKAAWDPVKTIFLCAPATDAASPEKAEAFAKKTGWVDAVEEDAGLLILPLTENWQNEPLDRIPTLYQENRNAFIAKGGVSTPGRHGVVWTWETLIYLAGYGDGADYAGNVLIAYPNHFAGTVLVNGCAHDFTAGEKPSDHWLVPHPSPDYQVMNKEIPTSVWLFGDCGSSQPMVDYLKIVNKAEKTDHLPYVPEGAEKYADPADPVRQICLLKDIPEEDTASLSMRAFFDHIIRWKNGPDGQLRYRIGKTDFYHTRRYAHDQIKADGNVYPYAVYLPAGMKKEEVCGLPLVFSVHGRGEPAWIFAGKNGWEALADETREFIVVLPDSPYNSWFFERDPHAIPEIIQKIAEDYGIDTERVYMTGFSNGAVYTNQVCTAYPQLFAAASPWNGPGRSFSRDHGLGIYYDDAFETSGYDLPIWIAVGDNDNKASGDREDELEVMLPANGCDRNKEEIRDGSNFYTREKGYVDGDRMTTRVFRNKAGKERVCLTVMKNMPHGAVWDESRAAWNFMKQFKRFKNSKKVQEV